MTLTLTTTLGAGQPSGEPDINTYLRPGGTDTYKRPGGTDNYQRP